MADDMRRAIYVPGYDDDVHSFHPPKRRWAGVRVALVALAIIGIVAALFRLYMSATELPGNAGTPVVVAPDGPYRVAAPEAPSDDLQVYDRGSGATSDVAAQPAAAQPAIPTPAEAARVDNAAPVDLREPIGGFAAEGSSGSFDPRFRPKFDRNGKLYAQVAALRSEEAAIEAWRRWTNRAALLFPEDRRSIERADLGAKGIYFRLRTGPFSDPAAAQAYCTQIEALGQNCIVVGQ
jgi:hypothetical protein